MLTPREEVFPLKFLALISLTSRLAEFMTLEFLVHTCCDYSLSYLKAFNPSFFYSSELN
jgi:hypothetical protein